MADDFNSNYFGGKRSAPKPEFGEAPGGKQDPVATFSTRPADPHGTGHILNNASRSSRKPGGAGGGLPGLNSLESEGPLAGLESSVSDIIDRSGLGRRAPAGPTAGEQMSDADAATQTVEADSDGTFTHSRYDGSNDSVTQSPLGAYANVGRRTFGMRASSSDPNFFGNEA